MSVLTVTVVIMSEPLWLTAVLRIAGEATPAIIIQQHTQTAHEQLLRLLRTRGGRFPRISPAELGRAAWPLATAAQVDVSEGLLARVHIAEAARSIVPADELPMTALWMVAAKGRTRVLLAVANPGVFEAGEPTLPEEELYTRLGAAAGARALHGGLAEFFVDRVLRRKGLILPGVSPA